MQRTVFNAYQAIADSYSERIDTKPHNAYYDRPATLSLLPDLSGKHVLDAACGPGKYAQLMIEQGATVTGFDFSPKMIAHAKKRNPSKASFFVQDLTTPFTSLQADTFDVVLCALALHYVPDWNKPLKAFYRVLKPGGTLVISTQHPFFDYTYFQATEYFKTEEVSSLWRSFDKPVEMPGFRRSLQDTIMPIIKNGFRLDKLLEPLPTKEFQKVDPKHYRELNRFPLFLCIRAVKM